jgi:hypothetical protein
MQGDSTSMCKSVAVGLTVSLILSVQTVFSQDLFEFQVYDADLVPKGGWEIDFHISHIQKGTTEWDRSVLPTNGQTHLAVEITRGFAEEFELGGYALFARRSDGELDYAGVRLRPRFKAPEAWALPVGASLSFEFGWPKTRYELNSATLEIRPIIDKSIGRWYFGINPLIARALRGPDAAGGLEFEPAARIAVDLLENQLNVGVQYFGAMGPLREFLPASEQTHFIHPNVEITLGKDLVLNLGAAVGLTDAAEKLIFTSRLGWVF